MDRRRPRRADDPTRQADEAARQAANLLTYYGRRYPVATVVVLAIALVVGLTLYWQQQRQLSERQQREREQERSQRAQVPTPPPATAPAEAPTAEPPSTDEATTAASSSGESVGEVNLLLGNPSGATPDPANRDNYLMVKGRYALSYNASRGTALRDDSEGPGTAPQRHANQTSEHGVPPAPRPRETACPPARRGSGGW